jgi:hypothetical protein
MPIHRILKVPAAQIAVGDVVLTYPTGSLDRVFTGYGDSERERVIERYLDHTDGEIYIKTDNAAQYCQPFDHVQIDCLLTFGKNFNNGEQDASIIC